MENKFYRHFFDMAVEGVKLFGIKKKEAVARFKVSNPELLAKLAASNKSVILTGGHYQNWELFAVATAPQIKHALLGIYTPLRNAFLEKKFANSRSRLGLILVPKNEVSRCFEKYKDRPTVTAFAIDQSPRKCQKVYWLNFLGRETAVHFGAEKYAVAHDQVVVFGNASKPRRGYYELTFEIIEENPRSAAHGDIIRKVNKRLERQIIKAPEFWLWTHKRWKLNRSD